MRRFLVPLLAMSFAAALPAQPWPTDPSEGPSVTDPSVPLSYVGGDGSVSNVDHRDGLVAQLNGSRLINLSHGGAVCNLGTRGSG